MEKCLSCFPVKCPAKVKIKNTGCGKSLHYALLGRKQTQHCGGVLNRRGFPYDIDATVVSNLHRCYYAVRMETNLCIGEQRAKDLLTQRVASRCGAFHIKVITLVESSALWSMRGITARVFLVLGCTFIMGCIGTGDVDVWLRWRRVTCGSPGWRLVSLCYLLHICWDI